MAQRLNVAVRVLAGTGKGPHGVHINRAGEDEQAAPGTTTGAGRNTEPSGPREHPDEHRTAGTPSTDRSRLAEVLVVFLAESAVRRRLGAVDAAHCGPPA
ncbi:hypothetical protein [Streptomyces sp. NPDC048462]|uniref:hypothetical protein n=1 Tax=Streptomyces sp. NPDC048462 TaxID=3365555 RepID=UPI0037229164